MPVLLAVGMVDSIIKFIAAVVVFIFVLAATYMTTRFIGNYQKKTMHGHNFDVIETYRISGTKYLQLIRVGTEYVVIAICKDTVTMLCKMNKDEIEVLEEEEQQGGTNLTAFSEMFEQMKNLRQNESKVEENENNHEN